MTFCWDKDRTVKHFGQTKIENFGQTNFILIDLFVRSDAFKLCFIYQRPFSQRVKNIGSWQTAMEVMGIIGNTQNYKKKYYCFSRFCARLSPNVLNIKFYVYTKKVYFTKLVPGLCNIFFN